MVARYEQIDINSVQNGVSVMGEQSTTTVKWFRTNAVISDVANNLRISDRYRAYTEMINITVNYTRNLRTVSINQFNYSITWRGQQWRIADMRESNDRQKVTMMCYRNDPSTPV